MIFGLRRGLLCTGLHAYLTASMLGKSLKGGGIAVVVKRKFVLAHTVHVVPPDATSLQLSQLTVSGERRKHLRYL